MTPPLPPDLKQPDKKPPEPPKKPEPKVPSRSGRLGHRSHGIVQTGFPGSGMKEPKADK